MNKISLPKRWTVTQQLNAQRNQQAGLGLDHTVRALATRLGADAQQADALVLEARSAFTIINAVPVARDARGETILGDTGLPLTPEDWTRDRLNARS
jgi:hypothetical protein